MRIGRVLLVVVLLMSSCVVPKLSLNEEQGAGGMGGEVQSSEDLRCDEQGDVRCSEDGVPQRCDAQNRWIDQSACTGDQAVCHKGACVDCRPQAKACQGNAPARCADDGSGWEVSDECSGDTPACIDETGSCGRCIEESTSCNSDGNAVRVCEQDGSWGPSSDCPDAKPVCADGSCRECDPDQGTRCLDGNTPQECSASGQWINLKDCDGDLPVCLSNTGECGCVEDETRCSGDATRERCVAGIWTSISSCSGSNPVCEGQGTCVPCKEGQANRCSPDQKSVQECKDNTWISKQSCGDTFGGVCDGGACTSAGLSSNWLSCGDSFCKVGEETCCANDPGAAYCSSDSCPSQVCDDSNPEEAYITCDGPSDCPGAQQCCVSMRLDDGCGIYPDSVMEVRTHCAADCLGSDPSSQYTELEVCSGPGTCSIPIVDCQLGSFGQQQLYACDTYSYSQN